MKKGPTGRAAEIWMLPTHQQRSRRNRDSLLKAGEQIFARQGFGDAHVSDIARLARCSIGSFYRRFKDKQALFLALHVDMQERAHLNLEAFFEQASRGSSSLTTIFFELVENSAIEALRVKGYYRALLEISLRGTKAWNTTRRKEEHQASRLRELLIARAHRRLRPDFIPAVAATIRMITGNQVSMMLYGPGPFQINDPASNSEFTRILMGVAGVRVDEREMRKLQTKRRRRPSQRARSSPQPASVR